MKQIGNIGNIFITVKYKNEDVCLILHNKVEKAESISIYYKESRNIAIEKPLEKEFELPGYGQQEVSLPAGFEKWSELYFHVGKENRIIFNPSLKKLSTEAKQWAKVDSLQPKTEPSNPKSEQTANSRNTIDKPPKPEIETLNVPKRRTADYQRKAEINIQEAQAEVESLTQAYEDGESVDIIEIDDPTPSQRALTILNWMVRTIEDWKDELEQSGTATPDLIQTLEFANQAIKDKLKEIRGSAPPLLEPPNLDTEVSTDVAYNEFKNKCAAYVSRYKRLLIDYQLRQQIDETEYNQFIPQFIKDRLFNGVARFLSVEQFPNHLYQCLQLVGYEVVPIQIGETLADARLHDIQASRQTGIAPGTIVEVILPGLQREADGEIVQKPVVIRGE